MSHWQSKTTIDRADKLFSDYIRARDKWRCQYKFRCIGESLEDNKGALTCSHFYKRRHESVRYEEKNCDSACRKCHAWVEDTKEGMDALVEWKRKQLGENGFNLLQLRKESYCKKDRALSLLYVKSLYMNFKRHGDINMHPIDVLPEGLEVVNHNGNVIIARGEATNSTHNLIVDTPANLIMYKDTQGNLYYDLKSVATVTHTHDHEPLVIQPGLYRQVQEREVDHFAESTVRKVVD